MAHQGEDYYFASRMTAIHHTVEGVETEHAVHTSLTDPDEIKETFARAHGVELTDVREGPSKLGRLSVGFRRWNSSWDPHGQAETAVYDPNMN